MCRLLGHDDMGPSIRLGRTSFGSYVYVNPAVASCDLLVGIGGIYPQNTAAFGGGAKLVLGVLGRRSIEDLHFGHPSDDGRYEIDNEFRRDVAEMARMAGLAFSVSAMVDQHRRLIWIKAGNHELYYASAVAEAIEMFGCAKPRDADVVIANAYPMDVSATFMRSKGIIPLLHAKPGASRILIAGCSEGIGHHGLFPLKPRTGLAADVMTLRRHLRYSPGAIPKLIFDRALRTAGPRRRHADAASAERRRDVICFVTSSTAGLVGGDIPGMRVFSDWERVVDAVEEEQGASDEIAVSLYPCSPLQVFSRAS
jgi:nickel-dependent lactate racemase